MHSPRPHPRPSACDCLLTGCPGDSCARQRLRFTLLVPHVTQLLLGRAAAGTWVNLTLKLRFFVSVAHDLGSHAVGIFRDALCPVTQES